MIKILHSRILQVLFIVALILVPYPASAAPNPWQNQSALAQQVLSENFSPQLSANITTGASSTSVTFSPLTGTIRTTFKITNKGTKGAYLGWGVGTATAVASSGMPAVNCDYIPAGAVEVLDFQSSTGIMNTIAAIQDGGATTLEISVGFGN